MNTPTTATQKDYALQAAIYTRTLPHCTTITAEQARTLRRAQMTLHRWAEEMCNGTIQRDGEQGDGKPFRHYDRMFRDTPERELRYPVADREAGALRRVAKACKDAGLFFYHQTDPRGCALYVHTEPLTSSDYNRGIACL